MDKLRSKAALQSWFHHKEEDNLSFLWSEVWTGGEEQVKAAEIETIKKSYWEDGSKFVGIEESEKSIKERKLDQSALERVHFGAWWRLWEGGKGILLREIIIGVWALPKVPSKVLQELLRPRSGEVKERSMELREEWLRIQVGEPSLRRNRSFWRIKVSKIVPLAL